MGVSITMAKTVPLDMLPAGLLPNTEEEEKKRKSNAVPADMLPDSLRAVPTDMLPNSLRPPAPAPAPAPVAAPAAAPVITSGPNPFAVESAPTEAPVLDKSFSPIEEGGKGIRSGISSVKSIPTATGAFADVGAALTNLNISSLYEKIDKGEITDPRQIQAGSDFEASRARMYLNSKPEMRKALRDKATQEVSTRKEDVQKAVSILQQYQQENLVNKGRTQDLTDVEGITDFTNWAAYNLGSGGVQLVPIIAAAVTTGGLGVFATGTTMELSGGVQNRLNYILNKTKDVQDPKARADAVFDYVAKSGDVTLISALASGTVDVVLGPAAELIKRPAAQLLKEQTRKEIAKEIPKAIVRQGGEEFLAGGIQETIQIAAERVLGEQTGDFLTEENIKRIVNAAAAESVAGGAYGGGAKAVQAALAQKDLSKTDTPEGRAMRGLDAIANEEEKARNAEFAAATADGRGIPVARTIENLTEQEVNVIQRRLFAELGRPAEESELLEAFNEYVAEQNASLGVESGVSVAGISDTGAEQPAGTAGISDTGAAATPDTGGLGTSGVSTDQLTDRTTTQLGALDEARAKLAAAEARIMSDPNATVADFDAAQAEYDAVESAEKESVSRIALTNADSAFDQVDQYDSLQDAIDSYKQNFFDTLNEEKVTDSFLRDYAYKEFQKRIEELRQAAQSKSEEVIQETPAADIFEISALENQERNLLNDIIEIENEQKALLTKAGRIPAKNSPARQKYDKLEEQRTAAVDVWSSASDALRQAKAAQETGVNIDQVIEENVQEFIAANPDYDIADYEIADYDAQITKLQKTLRNLGVTDSKILKSAADKFDEVLMSKGSDSGDIFASLAQNLSPVEESLADLVPQNQRGVEQINQSFREGKISFFEYTREMLKLTERLAELRANRSAPIPKRGLGRVISALEDAAKAGKIPKEMADMAIWFLTKNPKLAGNLAISIAEPTAANRAIAQGADGIYTSTEELINLFLVRDPKTGKFRAMDSITAVHEILHHLERMLPENLRQLIRNEWRVRVEMASLDAKKRLVEIDKEVAKYKKYVESSNKEKQRYGLEALKQLREEAITQENIIVYLGLVASANASQDKKVFKAALEMITSGAVPRAFYALYNCSEFWAVTGSDIISGRYRVSNRGAVQKIAQYIREFLEKIKQVFGLPSNDPIIRGLDAALRGQGTRISEEMLRQGGSVVFPNLTPESYTHGTDNLTAEKIIREGRLAPDAGKRMYSYSQFGRKAVYLTSRNGWWLDANKAAEGRAVSYEASVPFKLDPKAKIRVVATVAELDAIAREIGEVDSNAMMSKLTVDNLDYEQAAREVKTLSFDQFVEREVKRRREQLQKYEEPGADTVKDIASWAAQDAKERSEFARSGQEILEHLRDEYKFLQNYENEYKDADGVTQKLLAAGIDGIYIVPDFAITTEEERREFDKVWDRVRQEMPDASPPEVYDAATEEYSKTNPTYFERLENSVASDQLALFRPELAIVDRARLAASRPGAPAFAIATPGEFTKRPNETDEQYYDRLLATPNTQLAPNIVELINNNDLNGALTAIGTQLRGFYGDLATRLAALNLPTQVRIGEQRSLIRQSIDKSSAPQQVRLFSYMRTKYPQFFAQFFKDYQKAESMEMIYEGLLKLQEFNLEKVLGPVLNEYNDVLNAYDDFAPGLVANGGYFVNLDLVNLNNAEGKRNGVNYYVLLHEVVHAATELLLQTPINQRTPEQNAAVEELNKLYDIAKANIKIEQYGLTSLSEFIAEVYTNQDFRNRLKTIPYAPAKTNVLTRFIQSVMKLVGMDNVAGRAMVEAEKLFNASRSDNTGATGARFANAKKPRGKGTITGGFRTVESLKERVLASRPEWKDSLNIIRDKIWDPTMAFGRGIKLGAVELRHLSDMAGTKFPLIGGSVRIIEKMISHRGKIMTEAAAIAKDWMALQKKNVAKSKLLGRVMLEATLSGVEVDPLNTKYYDAAKVDQRVKDAWNALGPEFQGIYRRVRDFYQKQMQDAIQIMRDRANQLVDPEQRQKMLDNIDRDFGPDKLIYPYFPLKRFGPYWFQVGPAQRGSNYKEFYTFESMGERNTALRQRRKELLAGNSAQRNLAENHIELGDSVSELLTQMSDASNILKTVNELIGSLPDKFSDLQLQSQETIEDTILDVQKELRDDINQLLYTLMPEQSMRKQMITRKQVQGASEDMLRVFASSATRIAYQQARAKYSPQYLANLNNARSFIKDMKGVTTPEQRRVYRDFLHEMERRYKPMLGMEDTNTSEKVAGVISDTVTVFMMSAPMSAFLQTIGFFQFTATQLGGRYGYVEATDRMYENFKTYSVSTVDRTLVPLKNGQMLSVHFPSAMESGKLTGLDKIAAQQLMDEEQVNVSQTYDMVSVGDRSSDLTLSKYQAFKRAAFMPLHQIERFNREIGLLTAFQLEYEKITSGPIRDSNGIIVRDAQGNPETYQNDATTPDGVPYSTEAYDRALTYAKDMVAITLGETTRQMRPRFFMNALLALPLKFKRYMITALYSMWSNFDKGFIEPFKTAEIEQMRKVLEANQESPDVIEQKIKDMEEFRAELSKEGRKALAGAMFNTFLVGGTVALPFYTTIFPLIIGMFIPDDDDDEFFDFDNWYRNYMEYEFGGFVSGLFVAGGMDPAQAKKLGRGIGEAVVVGPATKLTGGSLSDRVSLDIKSMAFRDMRYTSSARDAMLEGIAMALGPAAGLGLTAAEVKDLWGQGQYGRAFERGLPAILGKPVTATRYALEGAKTKRGDTLVEDITTTEIAMQAIGLAPYRVTKAQKQAIQAVEKVQKIQRKRTDIMNDMWMKYSGSDTEGFEAAYGKSLEFSAKYPTYEITDKNIADSFNKRMNEQLIANEVGARVDMKDLPIVLPMLKYGRE